MEMVQFWSQLLSKSITHVIGSKKNARWEYGCSTEEFFFSDGLKMLRQQSCWNHPPQADSLADLRVWADLKSRAAHSVINYSLPVKAVELLNDRIH